MLASPYVLGMTGLMGETSSGWPLWSGSGRSLAGSDSGPCRRSSAARLSSSKGFHPLNHLRRPGRFDVLCGLLLSLKTGYEISPRGRAFLKLENGVLKSDNALLSQPPRSKKAAPGITAEE